MREGLGLGAGAVTQLPDGHGIRQFLDIGTGLPTADNTRDVTQRVAPEPRIRPDRPVTAG
jgi:hypothetical protein